MNQGTFKDFKPAEYDTRKPNFAAIFFFKNYGSAAGQDLTTCGKNVKKLTEVMPHFGYNVAINETDISAEDFTKCVAEWSSHDFSSFNQFFLLIIAHGDETSFLIPPTNTHSIDNQQTHGTAVTYDYIEQLIALNETLAGKPKWLVFACCHGNDTMRSVFTSCPGDEGPTNAANPGTGKPSRSDFLVTHAAVQGYNAFYDDNGMVLLHNIIKRLAQIKEKTPDGFRINIFDLLTLVNADVAEYVAVNKNKPAIHGGKQMCEHRSTLTKTLHLQLRTQPVSQSSYVYQWYKQTVITMDQLIEALKVKLNMNDEQITEFCTAMKSNFQQK